jgi:hypothetical protein
MAISTPVPGYNNRVSYLNGLALTWLSSTTFQVGAGACADSTNQADLISNNNITVSVSTTGVNGLDVGSVANNTFYRVYLISSSRGLKPTGVLLSTSNVPAMPLDYDMFRRIGFILTNGAGQIVNFYCIGSATRRCFFDAPITVLNALGNTAYTALNLTTLLGLPPGVQLVKVNYRFVPNAAGNSFVLRPAVSVSTTNIIIPAPVAAQPIGGVLDIMTDSTQSIAYKTTAANDALSLFIAGFEDIL